jgi:hypothetical protein
MINADGHSLKLKAALRFRGIRKQMCIFGVLKIKQCMQFAEMGRRGTRRGKARGKEATRKTKT